MSEARREKLHAVIKSCFGLDDLTTEQLIRDATAADRSAVDLYHFTRRLNGVVDSEGRQRLVKMMWQVVCVDERVSEFKSNIIWRTADLLGVSSRLASASSSASALRRTGPRQAQSSLERTTRFCATKAAKLSER